MKRAMQEFISSDRMVETPAFRNSSSKPLLLRSALMLALLSTLSGCGDGDIFEEGCELSDLIQGRCTRELTEDECEREFEQSLYKGFCSDEPDSNEPFTCFLSLNYQGNWTQDFAVVTGTCGSGLEVHATSDRQSVCDVLFRHQSQNADRVHLQVLPECVE